MTKQTPLHAWHKDQKANMAAFGGYDMPLWYPTGAKAEHLAVIEHAGLFDTSHMAVFLIKGKEAFSLLQAGFSKDLEACIGKAKRRITDGECVYGVFLNPLGHVIDDAIVYQVAAQTFMVVVNAGMAATVIEHLRGFDAANTVDIIDLTDQLGKIDIQGPMAGRILSRIVDHAQTVFERFAYFSFKGHFDQTSAGIYKITIDGNIPVMISRTGYTGEFGFELFVDKRYLKKVWEKILSEGQPYGAVACGLAARDSLRAGAVLPLSHQDIGHWPFVNNPWEFALPYNANRTGFTKSFCGDKAIMQNQSHSFTYPFIGYDLRKISTDDSQVVDENKEIIGRVLTCVTDMAIGWHENSVLSVASPQQPPGFKPKGLCCGFVLTDRTLSYGQVVQIKDGRRAVNVMITKDIRPDRTARKAIFGMMGPDRIDPAPPSD